jgi:hypothetical protein
MALFVRMIIIAVNMTLHNNIFHSNSYIILICVMCLWPGLVVDTRYDKIQFPAHRIFNIDETSLSTVPGKNCKVLAQRGRKQVGRVESAERGMSTTAVICTSASGSYVPPMVIFARKRMKEELKDGAPPGTAFYCNDSGWMKVEVFVAWFDHFLSFIKPSQEDPALLILDGHLSHTKNLSVIEKARSNFVTILCLPPHTTHKLQPLGVSFMYLLNHYHDKALEKWLTNNPGRVVTVFQISHIFNESYMQACTPLNAINGFKKTGIFPYNPDVFTDIDFAAAEVTEQNEPQNDTVPKENDAVQEHNEEVNDENNAVQEQNDEANKKSIESNEQNYTNESCETTQNQNIQEKAVEDAPEIIDAVVHNSPTPGPSTKPDSPPTIAETSFPQNEGESSLSASSFSAAAPSMCHPLPKIKGRRSQRKRKSVGTVLLTSTPYKNMLEEEKRAKNALE